MIRASNPGIDKDFFAVFFNVSNCSAARPDSYSMDTGSLPGSLATGFGGVGNVNHSRPSTDEIMSEGAVCVLSLRGLRMETLTITKTTL